LNRFGKDIDTIDASLGPSLQAVNSAMATFFASVVTVVFFSPLFVLPAVILGYVYYRLGIAYLRVGMLSSSVQMLKHPLVIRNTGRDLLRMESNSRSPIFSTFSELLAGIVSVLILFLI
jgi:hypothetical protein